MSGSKRITLLLAILLSACSADYDVQMLDVGTGQVFATANNGRYRLDQTWETGISVSSIDHPNIRQGWKLEQGDSSRPTRHSLGNNEGIRILEVQPEEGAARIELRYLSKSSAFALPP
jgi:hypothetical protein